MNVFKRIVFSIALILTGVGANAAEPLLAVDFDAPLGNSTQSKFTQMIVHDQTSVVTRLVISNYTVTVAGGASTNCFSGEPHLIAYNSRDRMTHIKTAGSFLQMNLIDLIRDRVSVWDASPVDPATGSGIGPGLYLMVEGLEPNTLYTIQTWAVDHIKNSAKLRNGYAYGFDATFETTGYSSLPLLGSYTVSGSPTEIVDNEQYSITGTISSDERGRIIYKSISNIDGCGLLNGFTLTYTPVMLFGMTESPSEQIVCQK